MVPELKTGSVEVNGTELYYEIRGSGPTLLFIPGAEGDAEEYLRVAEVLIDEFTILSYDRRGFSRSPRPDGFSGTTVDEQADDAATLLRVLDLAPATVWGNSSGAIIALALVLRYPEMVTKALLHEPPLAAGMNDPAATSAGLAQATVDGKIPFMKMLMGEDLYNGLSDGYRARMEADDTWITYEFANFEGYDVTEEGLAGVKIPVQVLYGAETLPFFGEVARWLGERSTCEVVILPGNHAAHYALPQEVAGAIRRFAAAK